jgi:hypothetical protein
MKKRIPKTTPEEQAKWAENRRRLHELAERRLKEDAARAAQASGRRPEPA